MGFLDIGKAVLGYISESNEKMQKEYQHYREIYDGKDDETLKRCYQSATGTKRMAIASLLRERGYGKE